MKHSIPGLIVGLLFGAGLALSRMVDPARVLGFLDLAGAWNPALALVLAAALVPSAVAYAFVRRMERPLMAEEFCIPQIRQLDHRLLSGAAIFGIGWGLVGLCPGPAIAGLVLGRWQNWLFVAAMIAGMALQRVYADLRDGRSLPITGAAKMSRTKKIADDLSVCSFVTPEELPALAREFRTIINDRPDAEEPGQPSSAELEAAAREAGLDYVHIPVIPGQIDDEQVERFARALAGKPGMKLAFCRTGQRAASLWALSQAGSRTTDEILAAARTAGYDLSSLKSRLEAKASAK